jgi:hypothetical protein
VLRVEDFLISAEKEKITKILACEEDANDKEVDTYEEDSIEGFYEMKQC